MIPAARSRRTRFRQAGGDRPISSASAWLAIAARHIAEPEESACRWRRAAYRSDLPAFGFASETHFRRRQILQKCEMAGGFHEMRVQKEITRRRCRCKLIAVAGAR